MFGRPVLSRTGNGLLVQVPVQERVGQLRQRRLRLRRRRSRGLTLMTGGDRREVRQLRRRRRLGPRLPAGRQFARHPVGVQPRPGAVGDDRVQSGVQRVDQRLVLLGHRVGHEIVQAEGVFDDLSRIAWLHGALRLLRRRHPGVDLAGLQAGVDGVVVGKLDRIQMQRVDDVGLLDGALHDADALAGGELVEPGDRRPRRHDQREVAEVVAVGEADGAPTGIGGGDRRRADVEASRCHLGEQAGELGADEIDSQTELFGDRAQQLVVEPGELARRVDADARRRVRQRADGQHAGCAQTERVDVDGVQRLRRSVSCTCPRRAPPPRRRGWSAPRWRCRRRAARTGRRRRPQEPPSGG